MKRLFVSMWLLATMAACNNAPIEGDEKEEGESSNKQTAALPYTLTNKPDWERGSEANVAIAMNALKAYETANLQAMQQNMADSFEMHVDNFSFEGTRDSALQLLKQQRDKYSNISITMHDYESVRSRSRNEEWVGLWYTEVTTLKNGQVDSSFVMDDIQIKNGKVWEIDSKSRRLPAKP